MNLNKDKIKLKAYAKINMSLYITGQRDDGYHLIDSIFVPIELYDEIIITKSKSGIIIKCDKDIPLDERNTAYKAASLIGEYANIGGVEIEIKKNIPTMAGLGGGSSDAAAVLIGMDALYDLKKSDDDLKLMGIKIGADVPFFLSGGAARVQGIGEVITPITIKSKITLVIIKPKQSLSTAKVYSEYDKDKLGGGDCLEIISALCESELSAVCNQLSNDLERPASKMCPEVAKAIGYLIDSGAIGALMTGSGSCVFGIFSTVKEASNAVENYMGDDMILLSSTRNKALEIV